MAVPSLVAYCTVTGTALAGESVTVKTAGVVPVLPSVTLTLLMDRPRAVAVMVMGTTSVALRGPPVPVCPKSLVVMVKLGRRRWH